MASLHSKNVTSSLLQQHGSQRVVHIIKVNNKWRQLSPPSSANPLHHALLKPEARGVCRDDQQASADMSHYSWALAVGLVPAEDLKHQTISNTQLQTPTFRILLGPFGYSGIIWSAPSCLPLRWLRGFAPLGESPGRTSPKSRSKPVRPASPETSNAGSIQKLFVRLVNAEAALRICRMS